MTPEQFAYWCQGFVEVTNGKRPSDKQWRTITDHLALVFKKETPNRYGAQVLTALPMREYIADAIKDASSYQLNPDGTPVRIDHSC